MSDWLTNVSDIAAALRAIDTTYETARDAAASLPLEAKLQAYREARGAKWAAYQAVIDRVR